MRSDCFSRHAKGHRTPYFCNFDGCSRVYQTEDGIKAHNRKVHSRSIQKNASLTHPHNKNSDEGCSSIKLTLLV